MNRSDPTHRAFEEHAVSEINSTVEYRCLSSLGFEGYRVGNDGSVWTCRAVRWSKGIRGGQSYNSDNWKPATTFMQLGYIRVKLNTNKKIFLHRLILLAFVGPCPKGCIGCHSNGNKLDNRPENLRWDTPRSNAIDMVRHGTNHVMFGDDNPAARLCAAQVLMMRFECESGMLNQYELAAKYGVSQQTVSRIINRQTWRHI